MYATPITATRSEGMDYQRIWKEQCEATEGIRERFGKDDAIRYLIGEKFLNYLEESDRRPVWQSNLNQDGSKNGTRRWASSASIVRLAEVGVRSSAELRNWTRSWR